MGLTSALYTGLTGLNTSQFRLDVIGDNIANLNTTGFKGSRTLFQTQFSRTISAGTKPSGTQGGTNPMQVGLGSAIGAVQRSFTAGSIETTGVASDLAIEGDGFFVLRTPENEQVFTRDGSFSLSADGRLISATGFFVQGYSVNRDFELIPGALGDITIPLGTLTTARATGSVQLDGTLNSSGTVATQGTILRSQVLRAGGGAGPIIADDTLLTNVFADGGAANLLDEGDIITVNGVQRGGRDIPTESFTVTATSEVEDLLNWLDEVIGIDTTPGVAGSPGVDITLDGRLEIRGNAGTQNSLEIASGTLINSGTTQLPFSFSEAQAANGESVHTTFIAYDSIGTPITVDLTMVLEARTTGSSTWRFYAASGDDSDITFDVGTGTVTFDENGQYVESPDDSVVIDRAGTGATDPLPIQLDMTRLSGLNVDESTLAMSYQDGFSTGTLLDFSIGQDGIITGTFTNGLNQTIGQMSVATFSNPSGLLARSNNVYFIGPNSGEARITTPLTMGAGKISSGSLELSNVDLSREFVNLITSSTAFSAASRVISTSDQLLQELLLIARR